MLNRKKAPSSLDHFVVQNEPVPLDCLLAWVFTREVVQCSVLLIQVWSLDLQQHLGGLLKMQESWAPSQSCWIIHLKKLLTVCSKVEKHGYVAKSIDSGARSWVQIQICDLINCVTWTSKLQKVWLTFLICKLGILIPSSQGYCKYYIQLIYASRLV